jgi:hypothetical protein
MRNVTKLALAASLLAIPLFGSVGAHATSAPSGGCSQYNVAGTWSVTQSNIPNDPFTFNLTQSGQTVGGTASYTDNGNTTTGTVSGTVQGDAFHVVISWASNPASAGDYAATVQPNALANGYTYDVSNSDSHATWSATGTATCSTQTPTTKEQCKDGGWASGAYVDAKGKPFKNQGDCVSYVASNGKSDH